MRQKSVNDFLARVFSARAMSETCQNPLCKAPLPPRVRRPKRSCSPQCRLNAWILARAAQLLLRLEPRELWNFFHSLSQGQSEAREPGSLNGCQTVHQERIVRAITEQWTSGARQSTETAG